MVAIFDFPEAPSVFVPDAPLVARGAFNISLFADIGISPGTLPDDLRSAGCRIHRQLPLLPYLSCMQHPVTPDGRYFVVRGRLWRVSDPNLSPEWRDKLVSDLMDARRSVWVAQKANDLTAVRVARAAVDIAKVGLGERGETWWTDFAPDLNRRLVKNTPYSDWFDEMSVNAGSKASTALCPSREDGRSRG